MTEISRKQIAGWICDLNSYQWPEGLPMPSDGNVSHERVSAFMRAFQSIVPYEEWIDLWQERHGMSETDRAAWMHRWRERTVGAK